MTPVHPAQITDLISNTASIETVIIRQCFQGNLVNNMP